LALPEVACYSRSDLMQITDALCPVSHFTHPLDGREEHRSQDDDDADDHQQFQEREPATPPRCGWAKLHGRFPFHVLEFGKEGPIR
jgi:hypothetical protein